jgi:hypothetical protein
VLDWRVRPWPFVEVGLTAVGVPRNEAVLDPSVQCALTHSEDLLAERGLDVSYETVRRWVLKFGPLFAKEFRRRGRKNGR